MGLAAFGDHQKIDLPDIFNFEKERQKYSNIGWEECLPQLQLHNIYNFPPPSEHYMNLNPDDLAAWSQHQFEKYLLLFLSNIPKHIKRDNLCLGGGCALNILANTKILEEGIYKNVHVNTAPNDDGLHFGAALYKAVEYENKITLPDDIGYLGIPYTDEDIEVALC
jgi:carbamoyltransferase